MDRALNFYIEKSGNKKSHIAKIIGISSQTLSRRLNNSRQWKLDEAYRMAKLLDIPCCEIESLFGLSGITELQNMP